MHDKPAFWGAICLVIALMIWSYLSSVIAGNLFNAHNPERYGIWLVVVVNGINFLFGWLHVGDNLGDVAPQKRGLMASAFESDRLEVRVIAIVTIGCAKSRDPRASAEPIPYPSRKGRSRAGRPAPSPFPQAARRSAIPRAS